MLRVVEQLSSGTVAEIAVRTHLHENTVRGHLKRLREDGYVRQVAGTPSGQGRPVHTWQATGAQELPPYAALATVMTEALASASPSPHASARQAGKAWGAQLLAERAAATRSDAQNGAAPEDAASVKTARGNATQDEVTRDEVARGAAELVDEVMREQGFGPEQRDGHTVLTKCPLLSAAHRSDLVCSAHEGMVEAIAQSTNPNSQAKLDAFAHNGACVIHLLAAS